VKLHAEEFEAGGLAGPGTPKLIAKTRGMTKDQTIRHLDYGPSFDARIAVLLPTTSRIGP